MISKGQRPSNNANRGAIELRPRQRAAKRHCLFFGDGASRLSPCSERVAEQLLIRHPFTLECFSLKMMRSTGAAVAACLSLAPAACQQAQEPATSVTATAEAQATINEYLERVSGRFGALAISQDGTRAGYYICQARLWKNCDNYELNDRFVSIPSAHVASREALSRCGGGCSILYLNDERQY